MKHPTFTETVNKLRISLNYLLFVCEEFVLCCVMLVSSDVFTVINLLRRSCLILAPSGVFEILDAFVIYRLSKKD